MVNISQTFVVSHGCDKNYFDGTREIVLKNKKCTRSTYYPFWKKPIDVRNRVETRAQISLKPKATRDYVKRYMHYLNVFSKKYFSSDDNLTSDDESITGNASDTKQNLSSEDETIVSNTLHTGEDLIIDENTETTIELNNTTQTSSISDTQNPYNKNETNNQALPLTI